MTTELCMPGWSVVLGLVQIALAASGSVAHAGWAASARDGMTVLGAQLYFWARLLYVPVHAAGIPYLRTLVWTMSIVGIVLVLTALF